MKVTIIGSGNVATCLANLFDQNGFEIFEIFSRNIIHAETLASRFHANFTDKLSSLSMESDLYLLAVDDKTIEEIANKINVGHKMVVHCSGTISMQSLNHASSNVGVLYPLQSFNKNMQSQIPEFTFVICASQQTMEEKLNNICSKLNRDCIVMNDEQRKELHMAAVFVNNFTNHMVAIAEKWLAEKNIPNELMLPLLSNTFEKIKVMGAIDSQTGPAKRNDEKIINEHLQLLASHPDWQKIYSLITGSIRNFYKQ